MIAEHYPTFSKLISTQTVTAGAAGTDVAVPVRKVVGVSVDGKCFIKFSTDGTNAAATDTLLPAAGIYYWNTNFYTVVSIFAHSGGNVIVSVFEISNT